MSCAREPNPGLVATYSLFARTVSAARAPSAAVHLEFLIDRQGYIRAVWNASQGHEGAGIPELLGEVAALNQEEERPPEDETHVHS